MKHGQPETNSSGPLPVRVLSPGDPVTIPGRIYRVRRSGLRPERMGGAVRGDEWIRRWARQGFPPEAGPWIRLTELLLHGIRRRIYLRDLNQNNLVWDGAGWIIIDAGSANRLLRRSRVRRLYLQEIPLDWGRAAGPGAEEPIRELLEAVFAARQRSTGPTGNPSD